MSDIHIQVEGRVGRITLNRPKALNAVTYQMCLDIDQALQNWAGDDAVAMVLIDAVGDRAFSAGGDLGEMYATGTAGNFDYGRRFWRDEYRMNKRMFEFPKPVATLLQGFTMGGGVGVGCHASHRVVGDSSRIAMPECGIGLVPDVGGSLLLARAPGRCGEYLGITGARMGPGDAIYAGFADYYIPEALWQALVETLVQTADWEAVDRAAQPQPSSTLAADQAQINAIFGGETLRDILNAARHAPSEFTETALSRIAKNARLSMACAVELIHRARERDRMDVALEQEYRFTFRAMDQGDFLEGIRAQIIDKDQTPIWAHARAEDVTLAEVSRMLLPLGDDKLTF